MTRKRRDIQVRGVVMDNQDIINEGEGDIVSVYTTPDKKAYYLDSDNKRTELEGTVLSYTSRFL